MENKSIGAILGDLIAVLVSKEVINIDELKMIVGETYFNILLEEAKGE